MLTAAIALPKAFEEHAFIFGLAYLCVRLLHVVLFGVSAGATPNFGPPW